LAEKTVPTVGEGNEEKFSTVEEGKEKSFPPLKKELSKS
jgi:hypothetical protein